MPDGDLPEVLTRLHAAATARPGRTLVAVDGAGGSGKSTIATWLAARVADRPVVLLHADDFFRPSAARHARGRWSPEGFWLDAYDLDALVSWALAPLAAYGPATYRPSCYDPVDGTAVRPAPREAPDDAVVIVEGTFLHRDELAPFWHLSVYLDAPLTTSTRRMAERDGWDPATEPAHRYTGAQRLYLRSARPWERATHVLDTTDLAAPVLVDPSRSAARHDAEPGRTS
ncbi:uridine kinase [Cellulomonas oligotrophica]|uniref:Uridine kinase n=1 Tax=Cellulomonas oligotrophica TaxID=931536 RepID=A0A7Y9FIM2_9CELL|nr:uridine kinase [Cellulomonas oligotrophica]NYD88000.1 uridine kinase [Cellulomonas oligotrophica]GIG34494.1 uridine kinase [Cellulomonas oligotrophica]